MNRRLIRAALPVLLTSIVLLGGGFVAANLGLLSPFGIGSARNDSQVINAVERTQEVSLVSLGIQGIIDEEKCREVLGTCVPGTGEQMFIQYNFRAKVGLDGALVDVAKTGTGTYRITVPEFSFIGYDEPTFKVAVEDGGVLSWVTPDIDELDMVNDILDDEAQDDYVASYEDLLQEQTKAFYDSLIRGIDAEATTAYEFRA